MDNTWYTHPNTGNGRESAQRSHGITKTNEYLWTGVNDSETQESPEGRILIKKIVWKDMMLPLVSMFVPVQPTERKKILKKMIINDIRIIPPGAIIGGDFNRVENTTFDVKKRTERYIKTSTEN